MNPLQTADTTRPSSELARPSRLVESRAGAEVQAPVTRDAGSPVGAGPGASRHSTRKHVRGSSLLLLGRGLGVLLNFAAQVLVVRFLSVQEFGAFAFGLSAIVLLTKVTELGLGQGLSRFLPIYQEQRDFARLAGAIALGIGTVLGLGLAVVIGVFALQGYLLGTVVNSELALRVLLVMIVLTPLQALEDVMEKLFAVLAGARAVFLRRHLLGPLLRMSAVLVLMTAGGNVFVLATAYIAAGACGAAVSCKMLHGILRRRQLLAHLQWQTMRVPAREVFGFSLPLLSSDLVFLLRASLVVLLLESFLGSVAVAAFRAVYPVARLNLIVFDSFKTLFVPTAARLFARQDHAAINELYWRNATWLAVLTFPLFLVTFSLAEPTTGLLFGARYADSAPILAVLALGCFVNVLFGFNTLLLRVYGQVRAIVAIDLITALAAVGSNLLLIPRYGALGGAAATCGTLVLQNVLCQLLLWRVAQVRFFDARFVRVTGGMLLLAVAVLALQTLAQFPLWATLVVASIATLAMLWINLRQLDLNATFPEFQRLLPTRISQWFEPRQS